MTLSLISNNYIKFAARIVAGAFGTLARIKNVFPHQILLDLYYALIRLVLTYGRAIIWGSSFLSYLLKPKNLQNKVLYLVVITVKLLGPIYA